MKRIFLWLKRTYSFSLLVIFFSTVAVLCLFIWAIGILNLRMVFTDAELTIAQKFFKIFVGSFLLLCQPWAVLLLLPIYLALAFVYEKLSLTNRWFKKWLPIIFLFLLGLAVCVFVVIAKFVPYITFGTLAG